MTVSPLGDNMKNCEIIYRSACSLLLFGPSETPHDKRDKVMHNYHGRDEQNNSGDSNVQVRQWHR